MSDLRGQMLGRYRLDAFLGQGGMAQVYRATDTKLGRTVAVKVIHVTHAADTGFLQRFLQEARVVAALEHPNILPVYDFGEDKGRPFLVMPYLEGGTLADRMAGHAVPLPQAASWVAQIGAALDAAHEAGILHRDIKPANVLVGKGERLVLADFGIAKMLESSSGLTVTGMVVGTPIYMSPEQAQGRPASSASDRYSLGVIAYELISGRPPYAGESALALMNQHVTAEVPPISERVPGLSPGLDALFASALAKEPAQRPPSGKALAEALATFVPAGAAAAEPRTAGWTPEPFLGATVPTAREGQAPRTRPAGPPSRFGPSRTSEETALVGSTTAARRAPFAALGAAALVIVAAGAAVLYFRRPSTAPPEPAVSIPATPATAASTNAPAGAAQALTVVELAPAATESVAPAAQGEPPRLKELSAAFDDALSKGRLAPPAERSAAEALASLRREFPGAKSVRGAEERLASAFKKHAATDIQRGALDEGKDELLQARVLAPDDPEVDVLLKAIEAAKTREAAARPPPEPPAVRATPPAEPASPPDPDTITGEGRKHFEKLLAPGHRPTRADFEAALSGARAVLAQNPGRKGAKAVETYARGGLEYLNGKNGAAGEALVEAFRESSKPGLWEMRPLRTNVRSADGTLGPPVGWELALAYADARGEAETLIAAALQKSPDSPRTLFGRANLRRLQARDEEAIADAGRALDLKPPGDAAHSVAAFIAEEYQRLQKWDDAVRWYRVAAAPPNPLTAAVTFSAANILKNRLNRPDEAATLYRVSCHAGNVQACDQAGVLRPRGAGGRPRRRG